MIEAILPNRWKSMKLRELADKCTAKNRDFAHALVLTNSAQRGIIPQTEHFGKDIAVDESIDGYYIVNNGEFVYNPRISATAPCGPIRRNHLGKTGVMSPLYTVFKLKSDNVDDKYVEYFFLSSAWYRYMKSIANYGARHDRMSITDGGFFAMPLPLPPLPEQHAIAEILTTADKLIAVKERLIAAKQKQRRWLMQNLLTGKIRLLGFSRKWERVRLGEVCKVMSSMPLSRADLSDTGHCYLHYGDIHKMERFSVDVQSYLNKKRAYVVNPKDEVLLLDGDIVFVYASEDYNGVCKYVVVKNTDNIPFISGLHTIHLRSTDSRIDNLFKEFCFQNSVVRKQMSIRSTGMKVYGLNKTEILKLQIPLPPLPEQHAISEILTIADREIELLTRELEQQKLVKKYLMQQLLTGKIRVKGVAV